MNAPLIRPMRRALQNQLPICTSTSIRSANPRPQARWASTELKDAFNPSQPPETTQSNEDAVDTPSKISDKYPRLPRAVQALYLQPLRRECEYGVPTADLQLRSYSLRPLEFFSDFALRAAYYLGLPAFGPTPLPRIVERWTVPKSHFIYKKAQENFERITLRRLIQIRDGHPEAVQIWLAYMKKHQYPGVGMKANVWEFSKLDVAKEMEDIVTAASPHLDSTWAHLGEKKPLGTREEIELMLSTQKIINAGGR